VSVDGSTTRTPVCVGVDVRDSARVTVEISHDLRGPDSARFEEAVIAAMLEWFDARGDFEYYLGSSRGGRFTLSVSDDKPSSRDREALARYLEAIRDRAWRVAEEALAGTTVRPDTHRISIYDPSARH